MLGLSELQAVQGKLDMTPVDLVCKCIRLHG
jgi:hypothetical protein